MYRCPRCDKEYRGETPAICEQCKRPLVVNGRYRIGHSIEVNEQWGEDFDATDLKTKQNVVVRELRIRKAEAGSPTSRGMLSKYQGNVERLKRTKFDGAAVLMNAFEAEFKNSVCYYMVFNEDAWASLGSELHEAAESGPSVGSQTSSGDGDMNLDSLDDLDNILGDESKKPAQAGGSKEGKRPSVVLPAAAPKAAAAAPAKAKAEVKADGGKKGGAVADEDGEGEGKDAQISDDDLAFLEKMLGDVDGGGKGGAADDLPDYLKEVEKPKAGGAKGAEGKKPAGSQASGDGKKAPGTAMVKAKGDNLPAKQGVGGGVLARMTPVQKAAAAGGVAIVVVILMVIFLL